jgi:hypothetical protein
MISDPTRRYRRWYRNLLRLYPKPYRERFREEMEQTFQDILRERAGTERNLRNCALWLFCETGAGILQENLTSAFMQSKNIIRPALLTLGLLLVPLLGTRSSAGWNWSPADFLIMGILIFATGLAYEFLASKASTSAYRAAMGMALGTAFLLVWINLAVGIIGSEDNPANLLYFGVLALGFLGSISARLRPRGMSRVLLAMALAQMLVPVIALIAYRPDFSPGVAGVFALNALFATLFAGAALLFRQAGAKDAKGGGRPA